MSDTVHYTNYTTVLTSTQINRLRALSAATGLSCAAIVRGALDTALTDAEAAICKLTSRTP